LLYNEHAFSAVINFLSCFLKVFTRASDIEVDTLKVGIMHGLFKRIFYVTVFCRESLL
jgi:hypothetical protein